MLAKISLLIEESHTYEHLTTYSLWHCLPNARTVLTQCKKLALQFSSIFFDDIFTHRFRRDLMGTSWTRFSLFLSFLICEKKIFCDVVVVRQKKMHFFFFDDDAPFLNVNKLLFQKISLVFVWFFFSFLTLFNFEMVEEIIRFFLYSLWILSF